MKLIRLPIIGLSLALAGSAALAACEDGVQTPVEPQQQPALLEVAALAARTGCAEQPAGLKWQTQWYSDANGNGFSQMGPSFWGGSQYHSGCADGYRQHYAVDYPMQAGATLFSAIPGVVTFAGASSTNGYGSLGNFVVVKHVVDGVTYASVSAHLRSVNVVRGQRIKDSWDLSDPNSLPNVIIGRVGSTGAATGPHLHAAVFKNPGFDSQGRHYGGTSVKPVRMRCFGCRAGEYDVQSASGARFYTRFAAGRRVRY